MDKETLDQIASIPNDNNTALLEHMNQIGENVRNEIKAYIENTTNKQIDTLSPIM